MIQRIQTLYLLLAVAALVATLFLPIGTWVSPETAESVCINALGTKEFRPIGYAATLILSALVAFGSIFLWKNRSLQFRISVFNIFIIALSYLVYFIYKMMQADSVQLTWGVATLLPLLAVICTLMAIRGIRRDEKLIRSLDRIR